MRENTTPRISIAIAAHDLVPSLFAYDLASLCAFSVAALPEDVPFGINMVSGTYVHSARQELAEAMLLQGVTHMLWVDADMRFPRESLLRLLRHNKDVVGCNYAKRGVPTGFVAIKNVGTDKKDGVALETLESSTGLEEVDAVGFGMLLMKVSVLAALPKDERWFWFEWLPKAKHMVGEDVYFCNLVRKAGKKIYVDHDLSKEIAHIGQFEFRTQHAELDKEMEMEATKQ